MKIKEFFSKVNIFYLITLTILFFSLIFSIVNFFNYKKNQTIFYTKYFENLEKSNESDLEFLVKMLAKEKELRDFEKYCFYKNLFYTSFSVFFVSLLFTILFFINKRNEKISIREEILKVFPIKYRKVIEHLVENNYRTLQSKLKNVLNLNKVATYRLLKKMEEESFIKIEKVGINNEVILSDELKNLFEKIK